MCLQTASLGVPIPPRSQDVPLHQPFGNNDQWHQHHYGVPFMPTDEEEYEFVVGDEGVQSTLSPFPGDPCPSSSYPHPQDPFGSTPAPVHLGDQGFAGDLANQLFGPPSGGSLGNW